MGQTTPPASGTAGVGRGGVAYKWLAMLAVATGTYMGTLDASMVNIALPRLTRIFRSSPGEVLWVLLVYLLVFTGLMLILGRLSDMLGRKRIFTAGFMVFTAGLGLCALAQDLTQLIAFRALQAVGGAMVVANANAIITTAFPSQERGKALGILEAAVGAGLMSGPVFGGILLDVLDWRSIFYLRLPVGVVGSALAWWLLSGQVPTAARPRFDVIGSLALFAGLVCLLLAVNQGQARGWGSTFVLGVAGAGVILLGIFVAVEARVAQPVVELGLFRNRIFSLSNATLFLYFVAGRTVVFLMPFLLIDGLGHPPSIAGIVMTTTPVMMFFMAPVGGWLSDRLGSWVMGVIGVPLVCLGLFLLSGLGEGAQPLEVMMRLAVMGLGGAIFVTPTYSAIMGSVPVQRLGIASAMIATVRSVGQGVGLAVAGALFAAFRFHHAQLLSGLADQEAAHRAAILGGFQDSVLVMILIAGLALVMVLLRGRGRAVAPAEETPLSPGPAVSRPEDSPK